MVAFAKMIGVPCSADCPNCDEENVSFVNGLPIISTAGRRNIEGLARKCLSKSGRSTSVSVKTVPTSVLTLVVETDCGGRIVIKRTKDAGYIKVIEFVCPDGKSQVLREN